MYSLGIDVGYSSIKFVIVDEQLNIAESIYILHKGRVKEELKKHIDIYKKYYKKSRLTIGDDWMGNNLRGEDLLAAREYVKKNKIGYGKERYLWKYKMER